MLLAEELTLLALDDDSGHSLLGHEELTRAIAMALTFELSLRRATHLDAEGTIASGPQPDTGDPLLTLAREHVTGMTPTDAVRHLLTQDLTAALIARLAARGLVADSPDQPGVHPALDGRHEADVRERLHGVLVNGAEPSAHDIALITLVDHVHLTATLFPAEDAERVQARAHEISDHWREMDAFRPAKAQSSATPAAPTPGGGVAAGATAGAAVAGAAVAAVPAAAMSAQAAEAEVQREGGRVWTDVAEIGVESINLATSSIPGGFGSLMEQGGDAIGAVVEGVKGMVEGVDFLELISLPFRIFE